jgi:hypothetical protein
MKILNLHKSFVRVAKKMVIFFYHLVNCLYSLCLKFVAPSVGHMHRELIMQKILKLSIKAY